MQIESWQGSLLMKILTDYQGRAVRLNEERLAHVLERPEMRGMESALQETLRQPTLVIEARTASQVQLNYRFYIGTRIGDKWLCVVVKYVAQDAFVLTAYLTDKPKRGKQIWPTK